MSIRSNLLKVIEEMDQQTLLSKRKVGDVALIAVTKGYSLEAVLEAYQEGVRDFGESRVQEALEKMDKAPPDIRWHLIGRLQKNKVNKVVGRFSLIHSVDSLELAHRISHASLREGFLTRVLLEANTSGEETKAGSTPEEWKRDFPRALTMKGIEIMGLMTLAPLSEDEGKIRHCFSELRHLRDTLQDEAGERADLSTLSMGMSNDFALAIQEGATLVRIGSAIFSPTP